MPSGSPSRDLSIEPNFTFIGPVLEALPKRLVKLFHELMERDEFLSLLSNFMLVTKLCVSLLSGIATGTWYC